MTMPMMTRRSALLTGIAAAISPPAAAQTATSPRRVLWAANVRNKSFKQRLEAANAGAFTHMSIFPIDWRTWTSQGLTPAAARTRLKDAGVKTLAVDPFVQWVPGFQIPNGYPAGYLSFISFTEAEILQYAEALEAEVINCVEGLGLSYPQQQLVDAFGAFADRAKARGMRVTLEFMPISSIADLKAGWGIVSGADRANAGLCFDTWHFYRSTPDAELLGTIPGDKIFEVQLADALKALQAPNLTEDLLRFRRLPGEGEFDLKSVTNILKTQGAWRSVGPEVFADAMDALDAKTAGTRCASSLARFI